jgi:integrase
MKLTDAKVKALQPKKARYIQWDNSGLGVRVSTAGKKSFIFMYRFEGRSRMMTIGPYPKITLAEARTNAAKAKEEVSKGNDPGISLVASKREDRKAPTLTGLVEEYLEKWAKIRKKTWREDERILHKDVIPVWGRRKAKDIKKRDVVLLLDGIVDRGAPITANKTFEIIRKMFDFAVSRSVLEFSPCGGIEKPAKPRARDRIFEEDEIRSFWLNMEKVQISKGTQLVLKLLLVTGQRRGETVAAEWKEMDLEKQVWTIPGSKTKNGNPHKVPLSPLAMEILLEAKELGSNSSWVFPGLTGNGHLNPGTISMAIVKNRAEFGIDHFTPHDLRRTMASLMTGLGIPRLTVSKVLNHSEGGATKIYDRHTYDAEKRQALEAWSRKLESILTGKVAKVVNLQRK